MSGATLVWVTERTLTMLPMGVGVYHYPSHADYRMRTFCGLVIWNNDQSRASLVPLRRDIANTFADVCQICDREALAQEGAKP